MDLSEVPAPRTYANLTNGTSDRIVYLRCAMKKNATVITPMCQKSHQVYGIRIEKRGSAWYRTWAFKMKQGAAEREHFQATMDLTNMKADGAYPGCPHCKGFSLIHCESCNKIYCYEGEKESTCPWCGSTGIVGDGGWGNIQAGGY